MNLNYSDFKKQFGAVFASVIFAALTDRRTVPRVNLCAAAELIGSIER